jgi:hypothetical protein
MNTNIDTGIKDIEAIRVRALRAGEALRLSCVDEKLRRARNVKSRAKTDSAAWSGTQGSSAAQEKVLSAMRVHELYVLAFVEEARACVSAQVAKDGVVVRVEAVPPAPALTDPVSTPPLLERPVLGSDF